MQLVHCKLEMERKEDVDLIDLFSYIKVVVM